MSNFSLSFARALELAAIAHRSQTRKGTDVPYIVHPVHVSVLLLQFGFSESVVIAGLLHDVVEDTDISLETLRNEFGDDVARLVESVTEQKTESQGPFNIAAIAKGEPLRPWKTRKMEQLARLEETSRDGAALKAADALHNCRSTVREIERRGDEAWKRFRAPPSDQIWYYGRVAEIVRSHLGDHPLALELCEAVEKMRELSAQVRP